MLNKNTKPLKLDGYEVPLKNLNLLVSNKRVKSARRLADRLVEAGCPECFICRSCYDSMNALIVHDPGAAVKLAVRFRKYGFQHWLPDHLRKNELALNYLNQKGGR